MESSTRGDRKEVKRYRAIFGALPALAEEEWEAVPVCDMQELVRAALCRADAGCRELEAIHGERIKLGKALEGTEARPGKYCPPPRHPPCFESSFLALNGIL